MVDRVGVKSGATEILSRIILSVRGDNSTPFRLSILIPLIVLKSISQGKITMYTKSKMHT